MGTLKTAKPSSFALHRGKAAGLLDDRMKVLAELGKT